MKLTTTRQAIHDALAWGWQQGESSMVQYLTYLTRIEKSIRRGEPCGDFLEAAYICAAINTLPGHVGGWLKFAYGPDDSKVIQTALAAKLRFDTFRIAGPRKHQRWTALAETTLEGYRLRVWQERELPIELYAERMGIDKTHWARDWEADHKKLTIQIRGWDRIGMGQMSVMVRSLNGDIDNRPAEVLEAIGK